MRWRSGRREEKQKEKEAWRRRAETTGLCVSGVLMVVSSNTCIDCSDHCDSFSSDNVHVGELLFYAYS
jgi:hypothetical protein